MDVNSIRKMRRVPTESETALIEHVERNHVSTEFIIRRHLLTADDETDALERSLSLGWIQRRSISIDDEPFYYFQLTARTCRRFSFPLYHCTNYGPEALSRHLATLWAVYENGPERYRLHPSDLESVELPPLRTPHIFDEHDQAIYRVLSPDVEADGHNIVKEIKRQLNRDLTLSEWIRARWYGFLILTETDAHRDRIKRLISNQNLESRARFLFEPAPTLHTLKEAINGVSRQTPRAERSATHSL